MHPNYESMAESNQDAELINGKKINKFQTEARTLIVNFSIPQCHGSLLPKIFVKKGEQKIATQKRSARQK